MIVGTLLVTAAAATAPQFPFVYHCAVLTNDKRVAEGKLTIESNDTHRGTRESGWQGAQNVVVEINGAADLSGRYDLEKIDLGWRGVQSFLAYHKVFLKGELSPTSPSFSIEWTVSGPDGQPSAFHAAGTCRSVSPLKSEKSQ